MSPQGMVSDFQTYKRYVDVEINGLPFIAKEITVKGVKGLYEYQDIKVEDLGTVYMQTIPKSREITISLEGGEFTKILYNYLKSIATPTVKLKILAVDDEITAIIDDIDIKYDHDETAFFPDDANDLFSYATVELSLKETFEPPKDFIIKSENVKPADATSQTVPKPDTGTPAQAGLQIKAKPSCAFCMKKEKYQYVYYIATYENRCTHCSGKLTVETSNRVPESQYHCTKCGANYCGVCGREKVWDETRANKYRLKCLVSPKKV